MLIIEATAKTPKIVFNKEIGELEISGRSLPEDAQEYYSPMVTELTEWLNSPTDNFKVVFALEYLNTSSSGVVRKLMETITNAHIEGKTKVTIVWCYEEDDYEMEEMGRHYEHTIDNLPIEFKQIEEQ